MDTSNIGPGNVPEMDRLFSKMPGELWLNIMEDIATPADLLAWISTRRDNFSLFVDYKATVLQRHLDLKLLPAALAVVRIRRLHDTRPPQSSPHGCAHLVDMALESLSEAATRSSQSLIPEDYPTIAGLLRLVDAVNCVIPVVIHAINTDKNGIFDVVPWLLPASSRRAPQVPSLPTWGTVEMYSRQQEVLTFELLVQALFRNREPHEYEENEAEYRRLIKATGMTPKKKYGISTESNTPSFFMVCRSICRLSNAYLSSASRRVISMSTPCGGSDRPEVALAPDGTSREPAPILLEALHDPVVLFSSGYSWLHSAGIHEVENIDSHEIEESRPGEWQVCFDFTGAKVRGWQTEAEGVPVYRIVCVRHDGADSSMPDEYLCQRDEGGLTVVRKLVTTERHEGWRSAEKRGNLYRMITGGIRPFARLVHMARADRDRHLADNFVRQTFEDEYQFDNNFEYDRLFHPGNFYQEFDSVFFLVDEISRQHFVGEESDPEIHAKEACSWRREHWGTKP